MDSSLLDSVAQGIMPRKPSNVGTVHCRFPWGIGQPSEYPTARARHRTMRVMFTTTGSAGHLGPLVPFADAVRRAGGDVLVATRDSSAAQARAAGFDVWAFADAPAESRSAIMASVRELPLEDANARLVSDVFGGIDARAALPGVLAACATWRPDVVVSEPSEFAGRLAGAHRGLPVVTVAITQFAVEQQMRAAMDDALRRLRRAHGIAGPNGAGSARFTLMPPLLENQALPGPPSIQRFREPDGPPPSPLPDWWDGASGPLVYLTFGSVAPQRNDLFPGLYRSVIEALGPLPARVLVTIGRDRDPADLGTLPTNIHVERWVPQASVMPHARAMVCHGGTGTMRAGFAAGIPQVVLPLFADQPYNAARVDELGAGIALEQGPAGVAGVAAAVRTVLADVRYADRAAAVAADTRALPPVDVAAARLRNLAGAGAR
jgi:UDP:flavonoid glycosyltransferase YjiC (YdhE family)